MPPTKKIIGVYKDGMLVFKGDNTQVAEKLKRCETYIAKMALHEGKIPTKDGNYFLRYTGENALPKKPKEHKRRKSKMSIKEIAKAAKKAGVSYGMYVAMMEAEK